MFWAEILDFFFFIFLAVKIFSIFEYACFCNWFEIYLKLSLLFDYSYLLVFTFH